MQQASGVRQHLRYQSQRLPSASRQLKRISKIVIVYFNIVILKYEGHLESKEHFAIKKYLLIIGKKKNMQVLSYTFIYIST
jgi:hypothetical protein